MFLIVNKHIEDCGNLWFTNGNYWFIEVNMTVDDLKDHFGVEKDIHLTKTILGITRGTVSKWRHRGIPVDTQARIQVLTNGKLKADLSSVVARV